MVITCGNGSAMPNLAIENRKNQLHYQKHHLTYLNQMKYFRVMHRTDFNPNTYSWRYKTLTIW